MHEGREQREAGADHAVRRARIKRLSANPQTPDQIHDPSATFQSHQTCSLRSVASKYTPMYVNRDRNREGLEEWPFFPVADADRSAR